ncbi:MAG: hypothetical protein D6754_14915 [Alphaproteobacteria bacterium]|nr:MAG: hypothetical protein D6754_14915 [Alphaproteobacteria bacterium]
MTVSYQSGFSGRVGRVCHTVSEVIYSAFDRHFAAYTYATTGHALPRARVETVLLDAEGAVRRQVSAGCTTVLDALIVIGQKAQTETSTAFSISPGGRERHLQSLPDLRPVLLDRGHFDIMDAAQALIGDIADPGLCRVVADFEGVSIYHPLHDTVFCEIELASGIVTFPTEGIHEESIKLALMNFADAARDKPALRTRLRAMRDEIGQARRQAVDSFGRACDEEVVRLHGAIADRDHGSHVAAVTGELLDRLIVSFGSDLRGLSPHARVIALDWLESGTARKLLERDIAA